MTVVAAKQDRLLSFSVGDKNQTLAVDDVFDTNWAKVSESVRSWAKDKAKITLARLVSFSVPGGQSIAPGGWATLAGCQTYDTFKSALAGLLGIPLAELSGSQVRNFLAAADDAIDNLDRQPRQPYERQTLRLDDRIWGDVLSDRLQYGHSGRADEVRIGVLEGNPRGLPAVGFLRSQAPADLPTARASKTAEARAKDEVLEGARAGDVSLLARYPKLRNDVDIALAAVRAQGPDRETMKKVLGAFSRQVQDNPLVAFAALGVAPAVFDDLPESQRNRPEIACYAASKLQDDAPHLKLGAKLRKKLSTDPAFALSLVTSKGGLWLLHEVPARVQCKPGFAAAVLYAYPDWEYEAEARLCRQAMANPDVWIAWANEIQADVAKQSTLTLAMATYKVSYPKDYAEMKADAALRGVSNIDGFSSASDVVNQLSHISPVAQELATLKLRSLDEYERLKADIARVGITRPERFHSLAMLKRVVADTLAPPSDKRPTALIFAARADHTGFFTYNCYEQIAHEGYRLVYIESERDRELEEGCQRFMAPPHQKAVLVIDAAHGAPDVQRLGYATGTLDDFIDMADAAKLSRLKNYVADDSDTVSVSCLTGAGRERQANNANFWAMLLPSARMHASVRSLQAYWTLRVVTPSVLLRFEHHRLTAVHFFGEPDAPPPDRGLTEYEPR